MDGSCRAKVKKKIKVGKGKGKGVKFWAGKKVAKTSKGGGKGGGAEEKDKTTKKVDVALLPKPADADDGADETGKKKSKAKGSGSKSIAGVENNWRRFEFEHGELVYNEVDQSLSAHCKLHGSRCRLPKSLKKKGVGYLIRWLERAKEFEKGAEHAQAHMNLKYEVRMHSFASTTVILHKIWHSICVCSQLVVVFGSFAIFSRLHVCACGGHYALMSTRLLAASLHGPWLCVFREFLIYWIDMVRCPN